MEVGRGLGVLCAAAANCDCGVHGAVGDPDYEYIFGHQIMTVEEDIFRHGSKNSSGPAELRRRGTWRSIAWRSARKGNDAPLPATHLEKTHPPSRFFDLERFESPCDC